MAQRQPLLRWTPPAHNGGCWMVLRPCLLGSRLRSHELGSRAGAAKTPDREGLSKGRHATLMRAARAESAHGSSSQQQLSELSFGTSLANTNTCCSLIMCPEHGGFLNSCIHLQSCRVVGYILQQLCEPCLRHHWRLAGTELALHWTAINAKQLAAPAEEQIVLQTSGTSQL